MVTTTASTPRIVRHSLSLWPLGGAVIFLSVVLAITAGQYGYHRDELYFRLLDPAWGYIDQPPLTPLLVNAAIAVFGDSVTAIRIVSGLCAVASVVILTQLTREVGGTRLAQALTAWGSAGTTAVLTFGHVFFTASLDLVVWPLVMLLVIRALLRDQGQWWLLAGAVAGISTSNKLLVAALVVGIGAGILIFGPRHWLRSGWLWGAIGIIVVLALPNLIYQASTGWPQFAMGRALSENNADEVRVMMWPFLILLVGPVLAIFWVVAFIQIFRRPTWRELRMLGVVFVVIVAFVFVAGSQFYYTFGILLPLVAVGSVPVAEWARTRSRRYWLAAAIVFNTAGCAVTSLPLVPMDVFGASGLANVNQAAADQVGWQELSAQVQAVAQQNNADFILASNYGEAGALDRFGDGTIPIASGHNALAEILTPPEDAETAVVVGWIDLEARAPFATCTLIEVVEQSAGVDNEEVGAPIWLCTAEAGAWLSNWSNIAHLS